VRAAAVPWFQKKRTPRRSDAFRSRFLEAGKEAAPIRHARQLREYMASQLVQAVVLTGFLVALVFFAQTLVRLFDRHGEELNPWYLRLCLGGILVCFVLFARRLFGRVREIRDTRADLREANRELAALRDRYRRTNGD
jgi:hypothetical protein